MTTQYGRYGYRRLIALLRRAGWRVNTKRVERIWRQEGLKAPQDKPKVDGWAQWWLVRPAQAGSWQKLIKIVGPVETRTGLGSRLPTLESFSGDTQRPQELHLQLLHDGVENCWRGVRAHDLGEYARIGDEVVHFLHLR
jgi:hypothetical protein